MSYFGGLCISDQTGLSRDSDADSDSDGTRSGFPGHIR